MLAVLGDADGVVGGVPAGAAGAVGGRGGPGVAGAAGVFSAAAGGQGQGQGQGQQQGRKFFHIVHGRISLLKTLKLEIRNEG